MTRTDIRRKVVTIVHREISTGAKSPARLALWIRKDYPRGAPERGHSYLIALCGADVATR
jgi:hypothetical protein